ncbi:MAG: M20 family metallopeptidase [Anaerolineae bacterium]
MTTKLAEVVQANRDRITAFCAALLREASFSGHEKGAADLVIDEMTALGYDAIQVDEVGNVLGIIACGPEPALMLTAHMDVVDPADHSRWRFPPFSGTLAEGFLWSRGASDDKACLAAMIYGAGLLRAAGITPPRPVVVAATVGEEVGGYGAKHLVSYQHPGLAVIGEPSGNTLRRGHRGKFEIVVTYHGRSVHASAPQLGLNPNFSLARFLLALRDMPLRKDPVYGGTTVAPTLLYVDQKASNVIPAEATVHLDWRNAPGETLPEALAAVETVARSCAEEGISVTVGVPEHEEVSYTGARNQLDASFGSVDMAADDPRLLQARALLEANLGRAFPAGVWGFCTDGGHLQQAGIACLGFGPGDEHMAHVLDERVAVDELVEAALAYAVLAAELEVE